MMHTRARRAASRAPAADVPLLPAVVGFDMGMTASRACILLCEDKDKPREPHTISQPDRQDTNHAGGFDFSATSYPFLTHKDPRDCLGYPEDNAEFAFPLKMYLYFERAQEYAQIAAYGDSEERRAKAATALQKTRADIPQIDSIFLRLDEMDQLDQNEVADHLRKIFIEHLKIVRRQCVAVAEESHHAKITKLAVTLPPNWEQRMQTKYVDLLMEAWSDLGRENIVLIYESEAVGHWVFRLHPNRWTNNKVDQVIIADFGGHTLSAYTFGIARQEGRFAFYSIGDPTCYHGGAELYTFNVKETMDSQYREMGLNFVTEDKDDLFSSCMAEYRHRVRRVAGPKSFRLEQKVPSESRRRRSRLAPRDVRFDFGGLLTRRLWEKSFVAPLARLETRLEKVAKEYPEAVVILTGGSFQNQLGRDKAKRIMDRLRLKELKFVDQTAKEAQRSCVVSQGAALAVVNTMTVEEFMERAAFAFLVGDEQQMLPITLTRGVSSWVTLDLKPRTSTTWVSIKASTLAPRYATNQTYIKKHNTFAFWPIALLTKGLYDMRLSFEKPDVLVFEMKRDNVLETFRLPIYYDPGSCVCFVDVDRMGQNTNTSRWASDQPLYRYENKKGIRKRKALIQQQTNAAARLWPDFRTTQDDEDEDEDEDLGADAGNGENDNEGDVSMYDVPDDEPRYAQEIFAPTGALMAQRTPGRSDTNIFQSPSSSRQMSSVVPMPTSSSPQRPVNPGTRVPRTPRRRKQNPGLQQADRSSSEEFEAFVGRVLVLESVERPAQAPVVPSPSITPSKGRSEMQTKSASKRLPYAPMTV